MFKFYYGFATTGWNSDSWFNTLELDGALSFGEFFFGTFMIAVISLKSSLYCVTSTEDYGYNLKSDYLFLWEKIMFLTSTYFQSLISLLF